MTEFYSDRYTSTGALADPRSPKVPPGAGCNVDIAEYDFATIGDGSEVETVGNRIVLLPAPAGARLLFAKIDSPDLDSGTTLDADLVWFDGTNDVVIYDDSVGVGTIGPDIFQGALDVVDVLPGDTPPAVLGADQTYGHAALALKVNVASTGGPASGKFRILAAWDRP